MLTLSLNTLPREDAELAAAMARTKTRQTPPFVTYTPDFDRLYGLAGKYANTTNFIVIGTGDGVRAFKAIYTALAKYHTTKKVSIIETLDPDHVAYVRHKHRVEDSLVIIISESGSDPLAIQGLLAFQEYKKVIISGEGPLAQFAAMKEIDFVRYPLVDGGYAAGTEAALLPAAIIYIDVRSIVSGMQSVYRQCEPSRPQEQNPALQLAVALASAQHHGCSEIVVETYSHTLVGAGTLLSGLLAGKGQSVCFGATCQLTSRHVELFVRIEKPEKEVVLSSDYRVGVQGISAYAGVRLSEAVAKRYQDDRRVADESHIPNGTVTIDVLNPGTLGELIGFWQYVALYGKWLQE